MDSDVYMDEEYDFQYTDESESEPDVDLENQYYNSKALKRSDPQASLLGFKKVLELKPDKSEWGFRALGGAVTRNYSEKSISNLLDHMSSVRNDDLLQRIYDSTLNALKEVHNDRLWFKTNIKLAKLYFDRSDFGSLSVVLDELRRSCETDGSADVVRKGTQLLEIYALEIQMYTEQKNSRKLKDLYEKSLNIKSGIPHPLIMGTVRECGGKMYLREGQFQKAYTDFLEAFKNFDESGNPRRVSCLKYLVLANMLLKSDINPFDFQETKPYENDPEIFVMTSLVRAYQNNDLKTFQKILKEHEDKVMEDPFIKENIEELLRNVRTEVLVRLIRPFTRVSLNYLARNLNITVAETEKILLRTILDGQIRGTIDGVNGILILPKVSESLRDHVKAMGNFLEQLNSFHASVQNNFV